VETACKKDGKEFRQSWTNNMGKAGDPKLKDFSGNDYTRITFQPELKRFHMETLDDDTVGLLSRYEHLNIQGLTKSRAQKLTNITDFEFAAQSC